MRRACFVGKVFKPEDMLRRKKVIDEALAYFAPIAPMIEVKIMDAVEEIAVVGRIKLEQSQERRDAGATRDQTGYFIHAEIVDGRAAVQCTGDRGDRSDPFFRTSPAPMITCQQIVQGVQPQSLRDDQALRQTVAEELGQVESVLDSLLVDRPRRNILRRPR